MDNKEQLQSRVKDEAAKRSFQEIRNLVLAETYLLMQDLINQKEFAARMGIDAGKLSNIITKLQS